jgi:hypothetical protein
VSVQGLFDRGGSDHHVLGGRRRSHKVDIRRDREGGQRHRGAGVVGQDDEGGQGRDEQDGMVVLSVGRARW